MSKEDDYVAVLLEDIRDQNKAVLESVVHIQDTVKTLATKEGLSAIETKVDTIQKAVADTNKDFISLDNRVTNLEQSA
jgi:hypothetical protein